MDTNQENISKWDDFNEEQLHNPNFQITDDLIQLARHACQGSNPSQVINPIPGGSGTSDVRKSNKSVSKKDKKAALATAGFDENLDNSNNTIPANNPIMMSQDEEQTPDIKEDISVPGLEGVIDSAGDNPEEPSALVDPVVALTATIVKITVALENLDIKAIPGMYECLEKDAAEFVAAKINKFSERVAQIEARAQQIGVPEEQQLEVLELRADLEGLQSEALKLKDKFKALKKSFHSLSIGRGEIQQSSSSSVGRKGKSKGKKPFRRNRH